MPPDTPTAVLEWTFTPTNYFEDSVKFADSGFDFEIREGTVEARAPLNTLDGTESAKNEADAALRRRFSGALLCAKTGYDLRGPRRKNIYPDGHSEFFEHVEEHVHATDWMSSQQRTYQIRRLVTNGMLQPIYPDARQYTIGFSNNMLLRGVIRALTDGGFIPTALAASSAA